MIDHVRYGRSRNPAQLSPLNPKEVRMNREYYQTTITSWRRRQGHWLGEYRRAMLRGDSWAQRVTLDGLRFCTSQISFLTKQLKREVAAN